MQKPSHFTSLITRQDFYPILLAALVGSLVIMPIMEQTSAGRILYNAGLTLVLLFAAAAIRHHRGAFAASGMVTLIAVPLLWATTFTNSPGIYIAAQCVGIALIALAAGFILRNVLQKHAATAHSVLGAICVYLLLGQGWAMSYSLLEFVQDEPFDFSGRRTIKTRELSSPPQDAANVSTLDDEPEREMTAFAQFVYFSFVTMTTLGYGDIRPKTAMAETLTWLQAVAGQFYIAVLVARLVSALPASTPSAASDNSTSA